MFEQHHGVVAGGDVDVDVHGAAPVGGLGRTEGATTARRQVDAVDDHEVAAAQGLDQGRPLGCPSVRSGEIPVCAVGRTRGGHVVAAGNAHAHRSATEGRGRHTWAPSLTLAPAHTVEADGRPGDTTAQPAGR